MQHLKGTIVRSISRAWSSWCVGILVATAFALLCIVNLTGQGAYYDELHQATAAFHYLGKKPPIFDIEFHGIPYFNMSYSGAIKSNIYGLYLKYFSHRFTIFSWRLLGISFVCLGLLAFYQLAGKLLPAKSAGLFAVLLLSDSTVILTSRFDWGPTALALALRLCLLGLWLAVEFHSSAEGVGIQCFAAGAVVGIAIFEKLSSVILIVPLAIFLISAWQRHRKRGLPVLAGLGVGSLPLVIGNVSAYRHGFGIISFAGVAWQKTPSGLTDWVAKALQYLELGRGDGVRQFTLGVGSTRYWANAEAAFMVLALIVLVTAFRFWNGNRLMRMTAELTLSFVLMGVSVFLLPRDTWIHHWIIGTPFQYAAIALGFAAFDLPSQKSKWPWPRILLRISVIGLLTVHIVSTIQVETLLVAGSASPSYSPEFTQLAQGAVRREANSLFIAADWGTATQIYCFGNGRDNLVVEPYGSNNPGNTALSTAENVKKENVYVLVTGIDPQDAAAAKTVLDSFRKSYAWQEQTLDQDFVKLDIVHMFKFVRRANVPFL